MDMTKSILVKNLSKIETPKNGLFFLVIFFWKNLRYGSETVTSEA
jgi:hypothetical protein